MIGHPSGEHEGGGAQIISILDRLAQNGQRPFPDSDSMVTVEGLDRENRQSLVPQEVDRDLQAIERELGVTFDHKDAMERMRGFMRTLVILDGEGGKIYVEMPDGRRIPLNESMIDVFTQAKPR